MKKVTVEEYEKALSIVSRFKNQDDIQVTVEFKATIEVTLNVPEKWSIKKIKEELLYGYDDFSLEDTPDIEYDSIKVLYRDGEDVEK